MMKRIGTALGALLLLASGWGCAPGLSSYVRSDADFSHVRRAAVLPFQNLSQDLHAGTRLQSVFMSAVLQEGTLALVDLGETLDAMNRLRLNVDAALTPDQITALGKELQVDALFLGTVEEYGLERMSNDRVYVVTASFSLVETETGSTVWKAQAHRDGTSFWRKLFGGGSASLYQVSRGTVDQALGTLF